MGGGNEYVPLQAGYLAALKPKYFVQCNAKYRDSTLPRAPYILHCLTGTTCAVSHSWVSNLSFCKEVEKCVVHDFSHFSCLQAKMTLEIPLFLGKMPHTQSCTVSNWQDPLRAAVNQFHPVILVVSCAELNSLL